MIERLQSNNYISSHLKTTTVNEQSTAFSELLRQRMENVGSVPTANNNEIEFSKHAQQRVEERGIEISSELLTQLKDSVQKAHEKGAKNILAFDAERAFIINVVQNRVITAISQDEIQGNVFTNIDGAVLLK